MKLRNIFVVLLIVATVVTSQNLSSQSIEISGFTGIHLGGKARLYAGDFQINDAQSFGGRIAVGVSSTVSAEFTYMRTPTDGRFFEYVGQPSELFEFSSNYFQLGGVQEMDFGRVSPFGTVALGLTWWEPKNSQYPSKTQFSASVGAGLKV
jgi:hypothetical protein